MPTLNLDRRLSRGHASGKGGRQSGLGARNHKKSLHIVRTGVDVDFQVNPLGDTCDVEENHHMLEAFVMLSNVTKLKRTYLVLRLEGNGAEKDNSGPHLRQKLIEMGSWPVCAPCALEVSSYRKGRSNPTMVQKGSYFGVP